MTLVSTVKAKTHQISIKNYGTKLDILLDHILINQAIMIRNIWKGNLIRVMKTLELHNMIIIVTSAFDEDNKYYPKLF